MGGKPRTRPTQDIVTLAKELRVLQTSVAKQEQIAAEATALLAQSKSALTETRAALLAAAKAENPEIAAAIKSPRVPRTTKSKKTKRRAKPKSAEHWEAIQTKLVKAMKKGELYTTSELQELAGCPKESKARFSTNVRKPLVATKKIKKTRSERGNRSPRAVRWTKA